MTLVFLVPPAVGATVDGFQFGKEALWRQTTASPGFSVADAVAWGVGAAVFQYPFDTAESVTVSEPVTGASLPMTAYTYEDPADAMFHEDWSGSAAFASREALLAAWPAGGTAEFVRSFPEWLETAPDSGTILLNAIEPLQIPEFTNFDAIQAIDPSQDFTFHWTPWASPTGYIPFNIYGPDGEVAGAGLDGTVSEFTVPAGSFQAGVTYHAVVNFSSGYFHTGTEWEGEPLGWHYWNYRTEVEFTPQAPPRPLPDPPASTSSQFTRWRPLGNGWPDGDHGLGSLAWFQGQLYTGYWALGEGFVIGAIPIPRWDGAVWDWNLDPSIWRGMRAPVSASSTELLVGGGSGLAAWDGVGWSIIEGFWLEGSESDGLMVALEEAVDLVAYDGDFIVLGQLVVYQLAGGIPMEPPWSGYALADWDGNSWHLLADVSMQTQLLPTWVSTACAGELGVYASGSFKDRDAENGGIREFAGVAHWNGTGWEPVGAAFDGPVTALAVNGEDLYAGGDFSSAGGVAAANIARWTGTAWEPLGAGTDGPIRVLAFSDGHLYAGGEFSGVGGIEANHIARWDGSEWSALDTGTDGPVSHLGASPDGIYVSGNHDEADSFAQAGGKLAKDVAFWPFATRLLTRDLRVNATSGLTLRIPIADVAQDLDGNPVSLVSVENGVRGGTVTADDGFIHFEPGELGGDDAFTYRVSNGAEEATGTIRVTVGGDKPAGRAQGITVASGAVTVRFFGLPGVVYDVQRTGSLEDPVTWTTLTTGESLSSGADGSFSFTDDDPPQGSAYYRSVSR